MATRIYCDHCGNSIKNPNVLSYGPVKIVESYHQHQMQAHHFHVIAAQQQNMAQGIASAGQANQAMPQPLLKPKILENHPIVDVDLCDHCVPIWMERVRQITAQSDPD